MREMIDKVKNFNQFVNENLNNITFKNSVDEDRTTITAFIDNNKVRFIINGNIIWCLSIWIWW